MAKLACLDLRGERIRPLQGPPPSAVLCLGNFDGVHIAHAALLREGQALTERINSRAGNSIHTLCGVFCFFCPSGDYFLKNSIHPTHLTTLKERVHALRALGADLVWLCDFSSVRELSPEDFLRFLRENCGCIGTVSGYNHRFGKQAAGTSDLLADYFGAENTKVVPALEIDGLPVSSSRIRACLTEGDVATAARLLGRPYALESRVLHGKSLGHTWGFPTANQNFPADRLIPAHGVYAVACHTPDGVYAGVANIGLRPTVEYHARLRRVNCETHIIGFSGNLYDRILKVEFLHFIRPEKRFDTVEELKAAIRRDTETAAAYGKKHILTQP